MAENTYQRISITEKIEVNKVGAPIILIWWYICVTGILM